MLRTIAVGLGILALSHAAMAYEPKPIEVLLDQDTSYDASIPKPKDVTGWQIGEVIYTPDLHNLYINAVDAASDRRLCARRCPASGVCRGHGEVGNSSKPTGQRGGLGRWRSPALRRARRPLERAI